MKNITRRRVAITIETHEIKIIRIRGANSTYCERCRSKTTDFTFEEIARLLNISGDEVHCRIESGTLHLTEASRRDDALICGDSIQG